MSSDDPGIETPDEGLAVLREQLLPAAPALLSAVYRVDPEDRETLLDLAAMALTHSCWRNTCWEDAHGAGAIDDADQIVANIDSWRIVRLHFETGRSWTPYPPPTADALAHADRPVAGRRLTSRLRGTGIRTATLRSEVANKLWSRTLLIDRLGNEEALALWALSGARACEHWFGTPWWPARCQQYWETLNHEAANPNPAISAEAQRLLTEPHALERLIIAPDELSHELRTALIATGLPYVTMPRDYAVIGTIEHGSAAVMAAWMFGM